MPDLAGRPQHNRGTKKVTGPIFAVSEYRARTSISAVIANALAATAFLACVFTLFSICFDSLPYCTASKAE
jgi:hypothetical protein